MCTTFDFLLICIGVMRLLEDPLGRVVDVLDGALGEPTGKVRVRRVSLRRIRENVQSDLLLGVLDGVRAVADVTASDKGEVTPDGAYTRRDM